MNFNKEIAQCRTAVENCNNADAARAIGLPEEQGRQIGRWFRGETRPNADRVIALAEYLKVPPQALGAMFMVAWIDRALQQQGQAPVEGESLPLGARSNCLEI